MSSRIEDAMAKKSGQPSGGNGNGASGKISPAPPIQHEKNPASVDDHIVAFHYPRSGVTENMKHIRVVVQNMLPEGEKTLLMFTSTYGSEGKTTACLNFAASIAQDNTKRVLILDADLRDPAVHKLLGIKQRKGFSDLLASDAPVDSVITGTPIPGLSAILSGELPQNPGELLATDRAAQIFTELRKKYDYVIVDTAPVLPVVDTVLMAHLADGVVLIIESGRTGRKRVRHAIQLLNNANASVLGFLLNKGQVETTDYRYSYSYRY